MTSKIMKIERIWNELENDQSLKSGLLYKRYSGEIIPDVYVAIKAPERLRCIAAHLSLSNGLNIKDLDNLRDIKIETLPDEKHPEKQFLLILLLNNQHKDIFSTLCEDLIFQIADITKEDELIRHLLHRMEKWRLMFKKIGQQGLSATEQRGLYGELYFMRKFIQAVSDPEFCVNTWKGPEKAVQDFQYADWAVEIKTTYGKNQQKLHISSERQLDINLIPRIFLIHYSLEIRQKYGETLNNIVDNLMVKLSDRPSAINIFRLKLLEVGYFEVHKHLYAETGYSIRQENIFRITDDFPKITEVQVPSGVGDVRYSLIVPTNESWTINEELLFKQLQKD